MLAQLDHMQLRSEAPERLVNFYQDVMGMDARQIDHDLWLCQGPQRCLLVERGASRTLGFGAYRCASTADLSALRIRLLERGISLAPSPSPLFSEEAFSFSDLDGNRLVFGLARRQAEQSNAALAAAPLIGRLQHLVVASEDAESLMQFYSDIVGLAISDKMLDAGAVSACWLRTRGDREHHSFAIFRGEKRGIDHHSYEVDDWARIRDWADHLADKGFQLFWGPGRHGPGNNLFIFVLDPDGNKVELSAELETIYEGRPIGTWRHEPATLNRWGHSFMRS